jgi:hypothetical protein
MLSIVLGPHKSLPGIVEDKVPVKSSLMTTPFGVEPYIPKVPLVDQGIGPLVGGPS